MILKTLLFLVLMYFLVKFIARLFLPSPRKGQQQSNARVFYKIFQNIREQQKRQQQQQGGNSGPGSGSNNVKSRLDQIEDAEFEEIEEEKE